MTDEQRPASAQPRRRDHHALAVGLAVLGLIIAAEFVAITAQTAPRPPLGADALQPLVPDGTASTPALVWTNARSGARGGPVDLSRGEPLIVAACEGGGSIAITLSATSALTLDCSARGTAGPILLDRSATARRSSISVEATDGNPRYIVELLGSST